MYSSEPEPTGNGVPPGLQPLLPQETDRLRIRDFAPWDADALYALHRDNRVTRYAGGPKTRSESAESLERIMQRTRSSGFGPLAIEERASGDVIGWCGVQLLRGSERYEILYALRSEKWGCGFATEAAAAMILSAFELRHLKIEEIFALVFPQNLRSIRVIDKLGMRFVEDLFDSSAQRYASLYAVKRVDFFPAYVALQKNQSFSSK